MAWAAVVIRVWWGWMWASVEAVVEDIADVGGKVLAAAAAAAAAWQLASRKQVGSGPRVRQGH